MQLEVPDYTIAEFSAPKHPYCICIPVINEGERIRRQLERMQAAKISEIADILLCDGGSQDQSLDPDFLKRMNVSVLLTKKSEGKLSAQLRMGYSYALYERQYEGIVTVDGNNKDSIEDIPRFIDLLKSGYDFVQGSRFLPGGAAINTPKIRHLAVKLVHIPLISYAAGFRYTDTTNGYRAYSRKFLLDKRVMPFRNVFKTYELLAYLSARAPRLGFKTVETPVARTYPAQGKTPTKISFIKGNGALMKILFKVLCHQYDPKTR